MDVSFAGGIQAFSPGGRLVRVIDLPGAVNFAIADHRLLICADDGIDAAPLDDPAAQGHCERRGTWSPRD